MLYSRCMTAAWPYAYALVRNRGLAEEVVAESMVALVRRLADSEAPDVCLFGWLRQVVRNKACDHFRRRDRQQRMLDVRGTMPGSDLCLDLTTPERPSETAEVRERVFATLDRLDESHQHLLQMKYVENLSVQGIAQRLGRSEKSVESALFRARSAFRKVYATTSLDASNMNTGSPEIGNLETDNQIDSRAKAIEGTPPT